MTVLPTILGENKQVIEFGARVEQAKNLCSNRRTCRFGYTFSKDRDLSTSESRNLESSLTKQRTRIGNEEIGRRRVPRLRIDPRRRKNVSQEQVTENPVTIKIGGVPIVIPDFDLTPVTTKPQDKTRKVETTLKKPESVSKRRRNRFQTKRKKINPKDKNRTITLAPAKLPTAKPRPTTLLGVSSRARQASKISTTSRPVSRPLSNTLSSTLTSFDSLQQTVQNSFNPISTIFTTLTLKRVTTTTTTTTAFVPHTTNRPRNPHKGRGGKKEDAQPIPATPTTVKYKIKECPESLEKCVDTCVPLEDIYAYSACVVECGERCPVVLI